MPTVKSCLKSNEWKRLSASCYKYLAKTFNTFDQNKLHAFVSH